MSVEIDRSASRNEFVPPPVEPGEISPARNATHDENRRTVQAAKLAKSDMPITEHLSAFEADRLAN
jgi:hypothetical protein